MPGAYPAGRRPEVVESRRILVDARIGWGSGIGRYVANIVPRVAKLLPDIGMTVLTLPTDAVRAQAAFGDVDRLRVQACPIAPFSAAEQFGLEKWARQADLTWFTNYWVPLRWRRPFVATVHDLLHLEPALFPASRPKRLLSSATFAHVAAHARAVMFVSRFTAREFEQRFGAPRGGGVTHLGIDHGGWGTVDCPPLRLRERRVLIVAAAKRHKNFGTVLDAWARARVGPDWILTVVTPDEKVRSSINLGRLSADRGRVEVLHGLDDRALAGLYRRSAVVAVPSLYEGFGLSLLEGLHAGALCISSTAAALVEIAGPALVRFADGRDGEGWTQAIEQSCATMDDPPSHLDARIEHNVRHAANFTWDAAACRTAGHLAEALANG